MIRRVLAETARAIEAGTPVITALTTARDALAAAGMGEIDYLDLRGDPDLKEMQAADRPARLFIAIWLDGVRLIDNLPVGAAQPARTSGPRTVQPA